MSSSVFRLLVSCAAFVLGCQGLHHRPSGRLFEGGEEIVRWSPKGGESAELPSIFAVSSSEESSAEDRNRYLDESDASEEQQQQLGVGLSKRRKGPTLSVVSPLEVLRQRLRLDRAKERIRENQKQIVANEELLEKIGKRSGGLFAAAGNLLQP